MKPLLLHIAAILIAAGSLDAQETPTPPPATGDNVRVFVDNCPCSLDYLRTEIPYIDYMRDRADADVHILFSFQSTGAGGTSYTLTFIGLRQFAGTVDTLRFATQPSATEDQTRQTLVRYLKAGLMRFVARTPRMEGIRITWAAPAAAGPTPQRDPANDPWNYWVFRVSLGGGGNGEKSRSSVSSNGSLSATRTTETWKTRVTTNGRYNTSKVTIPNRIFTDTLPDGTIESDTSFGRIVRTYTHSVSANGFIVRSLGQYFSAGTTMSASASSFSNHDLTFRIAPAFEYSVFPYSQSTRRQLTFNYSVGMNAIDYEEETIYFKTSERLPDHQLQVSYSMTQPWGSAFASVSGQQYLHDHHLYSASAFGDATIRLFKGFSLSFFGSASTIYNQIGIPRRGASEDDVLLNRRQLVTPYRVSGNISLTYTFGSIFNNIVNPRFGSSGGTVFFF